MSPMPINNTIGEQKPGEPAKKKRGTKKPRTKKQVTVRLNEDLVLAAMARVEMEQVTLTDALEEGLWAWLQRKGQTEPILQFRQLAGLVPQHTIRLTLLLWACEGRSGWSALTPAEQATYQFLRGFLQALNEKLMLGCLALDAQEAMRRRQTPGPGDKPAEEIPPA